MKRFVYFNPTKIHFGRGVLDSLGLTLATYAKKVILVYGTGSIFQNRLMDTIQNELKKQDISIVEFPNVPSNPTLQTVESAIEIAKKEDIDAILAVGGGSVIDTAKAIAAGYFSEEGSVWDFFTGKKTIKNAPPIFAVLTLSGTASEMNGTSVICNEKTHEKSAIRNDLLYPKIAWIDPYYQSTVPAHQLSYTAMDVMSHVFEYYFAGYTTEFIDYVSEGIMKTVKKSVALLQVDPTNEDARGEFSWAATWALNGFTATGRERGDFSSHRIGHAISALYNIPHGQTLAVVQPAWMKYCYKNDKKAFARFGREVYNLNGSDTIVASDAIQMFTDWVRNDLHLPTALVDLGIVGEEIEKIASNASIHYPLGTLRSLYLSDVVHILRISNYS